MLKRLYDEYGFSIEKILFKEYRRLKLTMPELTILLALLDIYKKRRTFSILAISRRVDYNQNEIAGYVESLLEKGFITFSLEKKDDREREIFHMSSVFEKIEQLLIEDEKTEIRDAFEQDVSYTIKKFEQGLGRPLKSYELDNIRVWYEQKQYPHQNILKAIEDAGGNMSVKYVERILTQQIVPNQAIDQEVDQALDNVFKKIK